MTGLTESLFPLSPLHCQTLVTQGMGRGKRMKIENAVPEALIVEIFAKLPVKSLIRFMCLSKSYSQAISDPQFFSLHLHHCNQINKQFLLQISNRPLTLQSLSFFHDQLLREPVTLEPWIPSFRLVSHWEWETVGSCNGVLFLKNSESRNYLGILNPSIQRFKLVPFPDDIYSWVYGRTFSIEIGFGFDSCTSDFKIVIIYHESSFRAIRNVQLYSLRKNSWKVLRNVPKGFCDLVEPKVVFNGAFYWVEKPDVGGPSLLMFDFTDETFKKIDLPYCFDGNLDSLCKVDGMGEVKGKLSLLLHREYSGEVVQLEMWMREDSVWVRQFVFNAAWFPVVTMCLGMNDEVVLLMTCLGHIFSCDLKTLTVTGHEVEEQATRAFTYTPSLALLGEEN